MSPHRWLKVVALIPLLLATVIPAGVAADAGIPPTPQATPQAHPSSNVSVLATGFNNPRGLKFGPDGDLYVAEGGVGGKNSTVGQCTQVVAPVGPYTGSPNGARISKVSTDGERTTVAEDLPSSQDSPQVGGSISGVADVAFIGNTLYAVLAGGGCSHGVANIPNAVIRVNGDGTWSQAADLSAFIKSHPVKNPEAEDFEPDGTWYSLLAVENKLYTVEPNHGELDRVDTNGTVTRVVDISASQGHIVPTAMTYHDGHFYLGNLGTFPAKAQSKILRLNQDGTLRVVAAGLTAVLGVQFDKAGNLYVLETSAPSTDPAAPIIPGTGRILRIDQAGKRSVVASGLTFPTAMTFGPDGNLYVSNFGFDSPRGQGQVVRVQLNNGK